MFLNFNSKHLKSIKRSAQWVGLFFIFLEVSSCATYQSKVNESRQLLQSGKFVTAVEKLKPLAEQEGGDQLIYLLDYATALQMSGDYKSSVSHFLKAEKVSEMSDYHSISRVAGATLLNEEMIQYKGDTFEKTFINVYLALNFLQLGQLDEALVEARRINEKYLKLRGEEKKSYEINPFAKYLSAIVWEADQKWDDAYIAYQEAFKISPDIKPLREDLIRSAKRARREEDFKKWRGQFSEVSENPLWSNKKAGELVIFYLQGWGPRKQPSREDHRFPTLVPVVSETQSLRLSFLKNDTSNVGFDTGKSSDLVYDVNSAAINTLKDDYGALVARRIAAMIAKDKMADELRKKDQVLGALAWVAMYASERADLRQWSTLPASIQIIRKPLLAGQYEISLQGLGSSGIETSDRIEKQAIEIKSGRKKFLVFRSIK